VGASRSRLPIPHCRRHAQSEGGSMNIEQERAAFEAFESKHGLCVTKEGELYRSHVIRWMWKAWQARAALQSQDMRTVIEALETAQNNECGPRRPWGSADPDSDEYAHDAFMWDYYQR